MLQLLHVRLVERHVEDRCQRVGQFHGELRRLVPEMDKKKTIPTCAGDRRAQLTSAPPAGRRSRRRRRRDAA